MKTNIKCFLVIFFTTILQGCLDQSGSKYCPSVEPVVNVNSNFFENISQPVQYVGTSEHQLAIACHNCYENQSEYISDSNKIIESGITNNVDFIELDIVMSDESGQEAYISHESTSTGPLFVNVIANPLLINATQILFLELKGKIDIKENIRVFFESLMQHQFHDGTYAYLNSQRFTVIRSIETDKTLRQFREVLSEEKFKVIKPYIKLSRLFYPKEESKMINEIDQVHSCGFHMIELETRLGTDVIKSLANYAKALGLAVNVFTIDDSNYASYVGSLKRDIDVLTVENRDSNGLRNTSLFHKIREIFISD